MIPWGDRYRQEKNLAKGVKGKGKRRKTRDARGEAINRVS
jgi:hypothetical protein